MQVRRACLDDAAAIAHVHVESWRTTYAGIVPDTFLAALREDERAEQWLSWLALDVDVFVAEFDGEVAGFASGGPIREPVENCDAELYAIYVLATAQGKGIGTALLRAVAAAQAQRGYNSMSAWVLAANPATSFYQKAGACYARAKTLAIGGAELPEQAYVWTDLPGLAAEPL